MNYHKGSGVIVYDPFRGDMKQRTTGWCVVNVDKEITRYFRWWLKYEKHIHLQPPSWDAHISIVRGEKLTNEISHLWKKYHGQKVEFLYKHVGEYITSRSGLTDSVDNGTFFLVEAECDLFNRIRDELKLKTGWKFHITFGRTYEYEARKPKRSVK